MQYTWLLQLSFQAAAATSSREKFPNTQSTKSLIDCFVVSRCFNFWKKNSFETYVFIKKKVLCMNKLSYH